MVKHLLLLCAITAIVPGSAYTQSLMTSVSVQGTHGPKYRTTLGLFHRTEDHFSGTARWFANLQGEYRPIPAFSLFGGYTFLYNHAYSEDNLRYWQLRHRLFAAIMPRYSWNGFNFNFRQMYQIVQWNDDAHRHNNVQRLRSRIYVDRSMKHSTLQPFAYYELFFDSRDRFNLKTHQLTVGTSYYVTSSNKITLQYRHLFRLDGKHPTDGIDIMGISYMYLFKTG